MTTRRGILGLLMGAPALAASAGPSALGLGASAMLGPSAAAVSDGSPLEIAYNKARRRAFDAVHDQERRVDHMPHHITDKKSWSSAYKHHVWRQERRANDAIWGWDTEDPAVMVRALKLIGAKIP